MSYSNFNIESCTKTDIEKIIDGLNQFNLNVVPAVAETWTPIELVAKDAKGKILGGLLGGIGYWNGLEIKIIWVDTPFRNQGLGSKLLLKAENLASTKGATISLLDTFDFQAKEFYLKNEYEIVGEIKDFPKGHSKFYLSKRLNQTK